jgi:hypothetical protein
VIRTGIQDDQPAAEEDHSDDSGGTLIGQGLLHWRYTLVQNSFFS